jgi:hypothetical protein
MSVNERGTYQQAVERVIEQLNAVGLPWPAKPADYGEEYSFPADPTTLTHQALGQLYARLVGWHGYAIRVLALADMAAEILQQRFDLALGLKMAELEQEGSKRALKDTLRARAIASDPALQAAAYALMEKTAFVKVLRAQAEIYENQAKALSREQTRRSDEIKLRMGGASD